MIPSSAEPVTRLLGNPIVALAARRLRPGLRVLAYHDVPSAGALEAQLRHVLERYLPVDHDEVSRALSGSASLADHAVWVTFDDGYRDVVTTGQPVLDQLGIRATLFICPELVDSEEPFWWDVVDAAARAGQPVVIGDQAFTGTAALTTLKTMPDDRRRKVVTDLAAQVQAATGHAPSRRQLTHAEIDRWVAAGHHVDNHTLDHPCLNTCTADEQARQITHAHAWLVERWPQAGRFFAYPNGNSAAPSRQVLNELGYQAALLFDHRIARLDGDPLAMSRLRVDAHAPLPRFRAIVSGAHPTLFHAARRLRR